MADQGVESDKGFKERRKKYEEKWALDEELQFKLLSRRNKLLGRWAAEQLGLAGQRADDYAKAVVAAGLHAGGVEKLIEKVVGDFAAAGRKLTADAIHAKLDELTLQAKQALQR